MKAGKPTAPLACEYFLIRLAPDPVRGDAVTIGVALCEPASGYAGVRVNLDLRRLRALSPHFEAEDLAGLEQDLMLRMRDQQPDWTGKAYFHAWAQESFSNSLQFTTPTLVLCADPAAELELLYRRYAATPEAPARVVAPGARQAIVRHLMQVFSDERVLARLRRDVSPGEWLHTRDPFRFDFHYQPARVHHCIQALPLAAETAAIKAVCFTVEHLRRGLLHQHLGLDVASFDDGLGDEVERTYHQELLRDAGIRVLSLAEAPGEAREIRARLG